ncbi:hypothetical protein H0H92_002996 [Tricholoma furcatifolium]|nr:hypothetical protein H0H92_002996 [Tricholoma furcatifolium]
MARPKVQRDYGSDATLDPNTGKIGCHICRDAKGASALQWLAVSSWDAHLRSGGHIKSLQICQDTKQRADITRNNYTQLYASQSVPLQHASVSLSKQPPLAPRPRFAGEDINGISSHNFDFTTNEQDILFAVDETSEIEEKSDSLLRRELERLHLIAIDEEFEGTYDETVPQLASDFRDMGLGPEAANEEDVDEFFNRVGRDHDYSPYESKTMCYLDILDNLPRLRLSSSQLKMILWIMRECGAQDDFSNPEVSPHIQKYPEDTAGAPISEMWQVPNGRWSEIPLDKLVPSLLVGKSRYYIHEPAELDDGRLILPQRWITQAGQLCADVYFASRTNNRSLSVCPQILRVPTQSFRHNYEQLIAVNNGHPFQFDDDSQKFAALIPNVHRTVDNGEDLFTIWVSLWADDVSGARSKQYQKHINIYMSNVNLPGRLLQQEYFVRFISTSPHASALEQFKPTVDSIKSTHTKPIPCYNAAEQRSCGARVLTADLPADNPQQSEESSHIGHQGKCKCRACLAGGEGGFTATPEGYYAFYELGPPRNVTDIRNCVLKQIELATFGVESHVDALQTKTGVKDKISLYWIEKLIAEARKRHAEQPLQCRTEISNELLAWLGTQTQQPYNPLLDVEFLDPSQDTLVEILHTILLGLEKYAWYDLHSKWTSQQQDLFTVRLQSTNIDGLRIPSIRGTYIMQYRNNLIGKHFKTLMQTSIFHIQDLVSSDLFSVVKAIGELGPVLWASSIENMAQYLEDLQILIDNVLDAFSLVDPSKILIKIKLHTLLHIIPQIRRRGPAVRFSTEVFECFNAIFRMCSILSNHQAPSRDIALKFADLDRVKHILSGGYWLDSESGAWVQAGSSVRSLLRRTTILQKHLGWTPVPVWIKGQIRPQSKHKRTSLTTNQKLIPQASNLIAFDFSNVPRWIHGECVVAASGDRCHNGSWAVFREKDSLAVVGRVKEILLQETVRNTSNCPGFLIVEQFEVLEALHFKLGMPVLAPTMTEHGVKLVILPSAALQFVFNVQHDCYASHCSASGLTRQMQERQESDQMIHSIVHNDDSKYIVNTHAIHNGTLLRKRLDDIGAELTVKMANKKAETQAKAAETRRKNEEAKQMAGATMGAGRASSAKRRRFDEA